MNKPLFTSRFSTAKLCEIASYGIMAIALVLTLTKGLLVALLSGLLAYSLVHVSAPLLGAKVNGKSGKYIAVVVLTATILAVLGATGWWLIDFFQSQPERIHGIMEKVVDAINSTKPHLAPWLWDKLPHTGEELKSLIVKIVLDNVFVAQTVGSEIGTVMLDWILGMVIGAWIALSSSTNQMESKIHRPLATVMSERAKHLASSFKTVVFAQVRISAVNATITAVFLFIVLPLFGVELPFRKTLVILAFIFGIMPVVGNTVSNFILVFIGLSHSLSVALFAFAFMFAIHKFEYFLNAKIMGNSIKSNGWEILFAIVVMKSLFGLAGIVAAPVFYAYLKTELRAKELI